MLLVGPAHAIGDDDRGVRSVVGRQRRDDLGHLRGREEERHGRSVARESGKLFALGDAGVARGSGQDHRLVLAGRRVLDLERGGRRLERARRPGTTS